MSNGVNRDTHAARCAALLRDGGSATVTDMAHTLDLSRTTVEGALALLGERGIAGEDNTAASRGVGRPARSYRFQHDAGVVAGLDVGIHSIRVVLADLGGRVVGRLNVETATIKDGAERMQAVTRAVLRGLEEAGVPRPRLRAIGVAISGLVSSDGRLVASSSLRDWEGVDIAGQLSAVFGCPVSVDNDIRLAAVAEHHMGAAQLADDVVYISIGYRISMGLILDGVARRGRHSAAGEIGHLAFTVLDSQDGQIAWQSAPSAEEVFTLARRGDPAAIAELERFIADVARGIATVTMTVDPDAVIIGGGLSQASELLLDPLREAITARIRLPFEPTILASHLGAESSVLGALVYAFSQQSEAIYRLAGLTEPTITWATSAPAE